MVLDSPSSLRNWKTNFFFVSGDNWEFTQGEDLDDAPKLLCSWGTPVSSVSFYLTFCMCIIFPSRRGTDTYACVVFPTYVRPRLKKRYHTHVERVKNHLKTVKDFDELISPQSLFLHFLGPKLSNHV